MPILSVNQSIWMMVINCCSASLSIAGSSSIIYSVQKQLRLPRRPQRRSARGQSFESRTYLRLLLSMSCFDIIASINMMLQPLLVDKRSKYPLSIGNAYTCTFSGCFQQISFGGFIYYGMLSYFYLFSIRLGYTKGWIARRAEPVMHTFAIAWPVVTGLLGVFMDWYSYTDLAFGCWVANYPKGCQYPSADFECHSPVVGWSIAGWVYIFLVVSLIVNNTLVYFHVRRVYRAASKRLRRKGTETGCWSKFGNFFSRNNVRQATDSSGTGRTSFQDANSGLRASDPGVRSNQSMHAIDSRELFSQNLDGGEAQRRRIRQVATQATLFVLAALATYLPFIVTGVVLVEMGYTKSYQSNVYGVILAQTALSPLAGFWNAVIYFLPQYTAARRGRRQSNRHNVSGSMLSFNLKRMKRNDGEGSNRASPSRSHWLWHDRSKANRTLDNNKIKPNPWEAPLSPTESPTRRASGFVALDTSYLNEPEISVMTASMLVAAKLFDSDDESSSQKVESGGSPDEKKEPERDFDERSVSVVEEVSDESCSCAMEIEPEENEGCDADGVGSSFQAPGLDTSNAGDITDTGSFVNTSMDHDDLEHGDRRGDD